MNLFAFCWFFDKFFLKNIFFTAFQRTGKSESSFEEIQPRQQESFGSVLEFFGTKRKIEQTKRGIGYRVIIFLNIMWLFARTESAKNWLF